MKETWKFIQEKLKSNVRIVILVVIDNDGSSPGQAGFKMAVADDGTMTGSIGGGQTEYNLVEQAKKKLSAGDQLISLKREVHRAEAEADRSGMICSGEQWVAFYPINTGNQTTIDSILTSIEKGEKGMIHFNQDGFIFIPGEVDRHKHQDPVTSLDEWIYSEPVGKKNQLYIFGAGHVGLALSDIASKAGFEVNIFDDRQKLTTLSENNTAQLKKVIDYKKAANYVPEGDHIYVVIMTFGHKSDEIVLRQFIGKEIKYLGMMGSKKKVAAIHKNLREDGFKKEDMTKIFAPIGIKISSQTPYEIAISIVAELIAVKNNQGLN
jgi:xanthine dehydrogenase accessory factor